MEDIFTKRCPWHKEHRDLISGAQHGIKVAASLGLTFQVSHVYGHQDANPWNVLDLLSTLNKEADHQAGLYRETLQTNRYRATSHMVYGESWILSIHGERIIRKLNYSMSLSCTWPLLLTHWFQKRTRNMDLNLAAYNALEHAMENTPLSRRLWLSKHMARFGPVGNRWSFHHCSPPFRQVHSSHSVRLARPRLQTEPVQNYYGPKNEWYRTSDAPPHL